MAAFSQWAVTCLLLCAALLYHSTTAAPTPVGDGDLATSQALDYRNETGPSRCYYNFQHYEEGDRIVTNEPCLNCTCHKRMLMCYLRVCPFTKAVGQDCTVEKKPDQCCPVITCPQVPVDILTSSTTAATMSSAVGHLSNYGCTLEDNTFYPDGVQMPSDPKKPCELCYCIRNHTACVRQECTLNVEGCRPIYQEGVCCPVRYDCDYNEIGTTEQPSTGGLVLGTTPNPLQCRFGDTLYNDGELMVTDKPCESCYCMRGDIVCAVRSCGEPMEGKDCQPSPPPEGECCPTTYQCANETIPIEALVTESSIVMHVDDLQTQGPLRDSEHDQTVHEIISTKLEETNEDKKGEEPVIDQKEEVSLVGEKEKGSAVDEISANPVVDESEEVPVVDEKEEVHVVNDISEKPAIDQSEGVPVVSEKEEAPAVSDISEEPAVDQSEGVPVVGENEEAPAVSDISEKPAVDQSEGVPVVGENEEAPVVNDISEEPSIDQSEGVPEVGEKEEAPAVSNISEEPSIDQSEGVPEVGEKEEAPAVSNISEEPAIDQSEGVPVVGEKEEAPTVNDISEEPAIDQSEGVPVVGEKEGAPVVIDISEKPAVDQGEVVPVDGEKEEVPAVNDISEKPAVDQSNEASVPQDEVPPSEIPEVDNQPETNVKDNIEGGPVGETIQSDPTDAEELEEEDIISAHIPTSDEGSDSSGVVTDSPADSLENIATSAPDTFHEQETNEHPDELLAEGQPVTSGPTGIELEKEESNVESTKSDSNNISLLDKEENTPTDQSESVSVEGNSSTDSNVLTPETTKTDVPHMSEIPQEQSEVHHVKDGEESITLPSDTAETITETEDKYSGEVQETSDGSTEQQQTNEKNTSNLPSDTAETITEKAEPYSGEVEGTSIGSSEPENNEQNISDNADVFPGENQEAATETNSEDTKVEHAQTPNDGADSDLMKPASESNNIEETGIQGHVEDVSQGSNNAEDNNTGVSESDIGSSDSTKKGENKEEEILNEGEKNNEPVNEPKGPDASTANESPVVLEESISNIPESPESLDQVKESETSNENILTSSNEPQVDHAEDNVKPTDEDKVEVIHDQVEPESNNSGSLQENLDESTEVPSTPDKGFENDIVQKEPIPPRKDDTFPEEHEQPPQYHEGSMTKAEDSTPVDSNAGVIPVETEAPIETEVTENNSGPEHSDGKPNNKPVDEVTEHEITHDGSENNVSNLQQESVENETTDVKTESSIVSGEPANSLLPEESPESASDIPSEYTDNSNTELPQTVITDQQPSEAPEIIFDEAVHEHSIDDSKPQENVDEITKNNEEDKTNENEDVPNVVVTETDVETSSVSNENEVKPESTATGEGDNVIIFDEGQEIQSPQTDKPEQQSEETSQETHDIQPTSAVTSDSGTPSTESTQNTPDYKEPNEHINEEHAGGNEISEASYNVSNDGVPINNEGESSTDQNDVVSGTFQTEINPEKTEDVEPQHNEESTESSKPNAPPSETTDLYEAVTETAEQGHSDTTDIVESTQNSSDKHQANNEHSETEQLETGHFNEEDPVKEIQTETSLSEDSANTIHQDDNGNTLKEQDIEKNSEEHTPEPIQNKPEEIPETQTLPVDSEQEKITEESPDTNEFHEVAHDPVESDPTDFDDQHFEDTYHADNEPPSENEIVDDHHSGHGGSIQPEEPVSLPGPVGIVPGEGDCLVDGQTYTNNSKIPSRSPCHKECICLSSILHCQGIDCPPPPPQLANCMPVHQNDLCCPVYTCDGDTLQTPQIENHMGNSEESQGVENQLPEGEVAPETPAHSEDEISTDLPKNPTEQEEPQDQTIAQTNDVGETKPDNSVQPEEEASEVQGTEEPATSGINAPISETVSSEGSEEAHVGTEERPDPNASSDAEEEVNTAPLDKIPDEENTKLSNESDNSSPTTADDKESLGTDGEQQPHKEDVQVETQTSLSVEVQEGEDVSSITSAPDSNVNLDDIKNHEVSESQSEVLTDESATPEESGTESSISTEASPLHGEDLSSNPDDNDKVSETEDPTDAVGEGESLPQAEDGSAEESQNPPAADNSETENNKDESSALENSNENSVQSGTDKPSTDSSDNQLSPSTDNESLIGEEGTNLKPEDNSSANGVEASPEETTLPDMSQQEIDQPVSNENPAVVDGELDVKLTQSSDEDNGSIQPEVSITSDDTASSDANEDNPVTDGQEIQTNKEGQETTYIEETEQNHPDTQNSEETTEHETTETIGSDTLEISETATNSPLPESNEPTGNSQETVESQFPETKPDEPSIDNANNAQTETHSDAVPNHSEEPINENQPDTEYDGTQEQIAEDIEKVTAPSIDQIENNDNQEISTEVPEAVKPVLIEDHTSEEVSASSETGADQDSIVGTQTEASHSEDGVKNEPLDENQHISEGVNVDSDSDQTPGIDEAEISHENSESSGEPFSTGTPFSPDNNPSTEEPVAEVEVSTKSHTEEIKDINIGDDTSISTEGYMEAVKGPESDDLTLNSGPEEKPETSEGSSETVHTSPESGGLIENEDSNSLPVAGETDQETLKPIIPEHSEEEGENSVSEVEQTVSIPQQPTHDSEEESVESELPEQGETQQTEEFEHPSHEVEGTSETQEPTEFPSISEQEESVENKPEHEISGEKNSEGLHVPTEEHSAHEDGTTYQVDTSDNSDPVDIEDAEQSNHNEDSPAHEEGVHSHDESPSQDENLINNLDTTVAAEGIPVDETGPIAHGEGEPSPNVEGAVQGNTGNAEQESEPISPESNPPIQELESPVQEHDHSVPESEHPNHETDQHIQEPVHSIQDPNLPNLDLDHIVHGSEPGQIMHETEEEAHPLHQPQDSNSVLPPSGETQTEEQDETKPGSSKPTDSDIPTEDQFPTGADIDYDVGEDGAFGPGTCRYGGKVYVSAQQIPRDDPCDFCFCFRSDIICLQQSCPPPIHRCHQEPIQGYCCPRYQCPVSMATSLNLTTTTTTTTTTLPPHFFAHAYHGAARHSGCLHSGRAYSVGEEIVTASGPCLQCICGADGQMKCDPVVCSPEPMLRKMMEAAISHRRR